MVRNPTPRPTHTTCTRSLYRGCARHDNVEMHKVRQVCYRKKKKPNRGERRGMRKRRGILSKTLPKKKETHVTTRNKEKEKNKNPKSRGRTAAPAPHQTNPPTACARSLSTGEKMHGGTNRAVCISHFAYHAFLLHISRTSSFAFLLLFGLDHADRRREPTKV